MMIKILTMLALAAFYASYLGKMFAQSRRGIQTNQLAKGNKSKSVLTTEWAAKIFSALAVIVQVGSIVLLPPTTSKIASSAGLLLTFAAAVIFFLSVRTMRDSWRAGLPETKTELITDGIYQISRNPAFLAFDLTYIGVLTVFFNWPLLTISVGAMVSFHFQILQEEIYLANTFGEAYATYQKKTARYFII